MTRRPPSMHNRLPAARTRQVALRLEQALGTPRRPAKLPPPLDMLIATVLSQNTNDKNSHRAYTALRERYRGWKEVAGAPARSIASTIRSGGMAEQKSRRIKDILRKVHKEFGGYSLDSIRTWSTAEIFDRLTSMKGVGPKTAACVILFSLGRDYFPVDTHIHRICGRLGLARGARTPEETFTAMAGIVPAGKSYTLHTNLIRFGRRVCRSSKPLCAGCPLDDLCAWEGKTRFGGSGASRADHDFMLLDNVGP